jgi:hypothetical protein
MQHAPQQPTWVATVAKVSDPHGTKCLATADGQIPNTLDRNDPQIALFAVCI